ncbi:pilus assembly protein PilW [Ventosimonas gracilis]|uniref:Pilus assembly protein PilW n=1 Tax=Ventosimonas gracilis TaxID=1680762 RepID=A0A139SXJ0_9GAMM|nr:type IV pilus biogenesis/stability protein PilW [Ventosimonas gracilis]KXU39299.1 pilus assembly protein PilW [Ventosimonas gracilis]
MLRALIVLFAVLLAACVREGPTNPLSTSKGRAEASEAYIQLGLGYLQEGETARAKVPLVKALELDRRSSDAHAALAMVFQAEMEPKLADEHFRKALQSHSVNQTRIMNNYGSFLYEQGRFKEAMQYFSKASEDALYAGRPRVFENMGLTALKLNQPEQAGEYFERTLRLSPKQPQALLELAELARLKGEYGKALGYYERFSELSTQNARSLLLGIRIAGQTGDRDKAKSLGLQLKRLYPATAEYRQYLSELLP